MGHPVLYFPVCTKLLFRIINYTFWLWRSVLAVNARHVKLLTMNHAFDHTFQRFPLSDHYRWERLILLKDLCVSSASAQNVEDEALSNFIPEESGAIGISIVHLHNSRSTTDTKNAHVATSNHDRSPLLLPVYQDVLDCRTSLLPDDARARERVARGAGGAQDSFCKFAVDWKARAA